jgi:hypothetical protein
LLCYENNNTDSYKHLRLLRIWFVTGGLQILFFGKERQIGLVSVFNWPGLVAVALEGIGLGYFMMDLWKGNESV